MERVGGIRVRLWDGTNLNLNFENNPPLRETSISNSSIVKGGIHR
jgi:hypothetical protein